MSNAFRIQREGDVWAVLLGPKGPRVRIEQLEVRADVIGKDFVIGTVVTSHGAYFEDITCLDSVMRLKLSDLGIHAPTWFRKVPAGTGRPLVSLTADGFIVKPRGGRM